MCLRGTGTAHARARVHAHPWHTCTRTRMRTTCGAPTHHTSWHTQTHTHTQVYTNTHALEHEPVTPQVFVTISPNDAKNGLVVRMTRPSTTNDSFPATDLTDEGVSLLDRLQNGNARLRACAFTDLEVCVRTGAKTFLQFSIDNANLHRFVTDNPVCLPCYSHPLSYPAYFTGIVRRSDRCCGSLPHDARRCL